MTCSSIGYNADERRLDTGYYDLLASEVRLTNFVVIAQGQIPQRAWFTLGRLLSENAGVPTLLSWSGSMFEYLMPMLVMPNYDGSCWSRPAAPPSACRSNMATSWAFPGAFRSRVTTPWTRTSIINIAPSVSRAWGSSAG